MISGGMIPEGLLKELRFEKGNTMIDLYTWPTPNGHKVHIMLEETGVEYNVIPIDINKGDQFDPEYLKISPNNKMPAMVDPDGPGGEKWAQDSVRPAQADHR